MNVSRSTKPLFVILMVGLLLIVIIAGCASPTKKPPTFIPKLNIEIIDNQIDTNYKKDPSGDFVLDEIVIVGRNRQAIEKRLNTLGLGPTSPPNPGLPRLELVASLSLNIKGKLQEVIDLYKITPPRVSVTPTKTTQPPTFDDDSQFDVVPLSVTSTSSSGTPSQTAESLTLTPTATMPPPGLVDSVLALVNQINNPPNPDVAANPNYLVYDPWSIGNGRAATSPSPASSDAYLNQWAFKEDDGIGLMTTSTNNNPAINNVVSGNETSIGIFDTSPFSVSADLGPSEFADKSLQIPTFNPLAMKVSHWRPFSEAPITSENPQMTNHGLFVAGLAHAVSPGSHIYLIRTLNDIGEGTLFGLLIDMHIFFHTAPGHKVINLSLGIPNDTPIPSPTTAGSALECLNANNVLDIPSLSCYMTWLHSNQVIVVASAGNEGKTSAEYPGSYNSVFSVAASNDAGLQACFSNAGDVMAPGGNGRPNTNNTVGNGSCNPRIISHCRTNECSYAVASTVLNHLPTSETMVSFAWWAGTSFSAPLVTGMVARALENGLAPSTVENNLNAQAGEVVNLTETLATAPSP